MRPHRDGERSRNVGAGDMSGVSGAACSLKPVAEVHVQLCDVIKEHCLQPRGFNERSHGSQVLPKTESLLNTIYTPFYVFFTLCVKCLWLLYNTL